MARVEKNQTQVMLDPIRFDHGLDHNCDPRSVGAQESEGVTQVDNPALPGWVHPPVVTVVDDVLYMPTAEFAVGKNGCHRENWLMSWSLWREIAKHGLGSLTNEDKIHHLRASTGLWKEISERFRR